MFLLALTAVAVANSELRLTSLDYRLYTAAYIAHESDRKHQVIDNEEQLTEFWTELRARKEPTGESEGSQPGPQAADVLTEYLNTGPPTTDFAEEFLIVFDRKVQVRSIIFNGEEIFARYSSLGEAGRPADLLSNRPAYFTVVAVTKPDNWPLPVIYHEIE